MHKCTKAGCLTLGRASAALYRASSSTVGSSRSRAVFRPAPTQTRQLEQPQLALSAPSHLVDQISHAFGLNDEQRAALRCDKQHIRLRAGPGSGKTRSAAAYACLAVDLADQQGLTGRVLAITFTVAARDELEERVVQKALAVSVGEQLHVSTIHGLCTEILSTYSMHVWGPGPFATASQGDKQQVVEDILRNSRNMELYTLDESRQKDLVNKFLDRISKIKNHKECMYDNSGLPAPAMASMGSYQDEFNNRGFSELDWIVQRELSSVYEEYCRQMTNKSLVDFEDQLHLTLRLLQQNPQVREELQARYHTILVDEAQDMNKCQHAILKELAGTTTRTIMVGDPEQGIFQFRGSEPSAWLEPIYNRQTVKKVFLSNNHRSISALVELGNRQMEVTRRMFGQIFGDRLNPVLTEVTSSQAVRADPANRSDNGYHAAKLIGFQDPQAEAKAVVELVKDNLVSDAETIGILFTQWKADSVTAIREALTAEGIPFTFEDDNALHQLIEVKAADALLRLVIDPDHADLHLRGLIDLCKEEGWKLPLLEDLDGSTCNELKQLSVSSNRQNSCQTATLASQLYDNIGHARAADVAAMMLDDAAQQQLYPLQEYLDTPGLIKDKELDGITMRGSLTTHKLAAVQRLWAFVSVIRAAAIREPIQAAVELILSASGLKAAVANSSGYGALAEEISPLNRPGTLEDYIALGTDDQHISDTNSTAFEAHDRSASGLDKLAQIHERIMLKLETDGRLVMTTVYKAKGREWDVAMLVDARSLSINNGTPWRRIQQLCNVLYTAITRAKDRLYITWNETPRSKYKSQHERMHDAAAFVGNAVDSSGVTKDRGTLHGGASLYDTFKENGSSQANEQDISGGASTGWQHEFRYLIDLLCKELNKKRIDDVIVVKRPRK